MRHVQPLTIQAATNGWIVNYGCFTLLFEDNNKLGIELLKFLADPGKVIDEYSKKYQRGFGEYVDTGAGMEEIGSVARDLQAKVAASGRMFRGPAAPTYPPGYTAGIDRLPEDKG